MTKKILLLICSLALASGWTAAAQTKPDALKMYNGGQYKQAIEVCKQEIKANDRNLDSYVVLIWALIADKQYSEALLWIANSKNISRYDPRILESEGEANYYLGRSDEAIAAFQDYIVYAPNGNRLAVVYYYLGELYLRSKAYAHADIAFTTAVQFNNKVATWWTRLGYAREQNREFIYALQAYERALALDKNLVDAKQGKMRVLDKL